MDKNRAAFVDMRGMDVPDELLISNFCDVVSDKSDDEINNSILEVLRINSNTLISETYLFI